MIFLETTFFPYFGAMPESTEKEKKNRSSEVAEQIVTYCSGYFTPLFY